jgi:tRNA-intron endonuclease, archaea type
MPKKKVTKSKKSEKTEKIKNNDSRTESDFRTIIDGLFIESHVILPACDSARDLYNKSRYGIILDDGKNQLSLLEALYLYEKGNIVIKDLRGKIYDTNRFIKKATKLEPNFWVRYCVFKDFRKRGYVIKTALKFGADFRVYDRGIKPGEDHAKWVVFPVHESNVLTWYEFAAKNRVAHSTKKRLLLAIVDAESDVTYYEVAWKRP